MKKMTAKGIITAVTVLLASSFHLRAIEGLRISVHCPDVVLSWPSLDGETYIVQYRPTLCTNTPWVTLSNSMPADPTTNWTTFVHSNQVQCASGGTNGPGGGGGGSPPTLGFAVTAASSSKVAEPLAMPADGSGSAVPLCIYPPGYDFSGLTIFDPSSGEWVSGSGFTNSQPSLNRPQPDDPDPQDDPKQVSVLTIDTIMRKQRTADHPRSAQAGVSPHY